MPDIPSVAPRMLSRVLRSPNRLILRTYFDLEVSGARNLPSDGPVVIAANHFSHLDPPLIAVNLDRYVRFLAVDEIFGQSRVFDLLLGFFGAISLDRDGYPVRAMREAISHLESGGVVGLFPEGRRVERWGEDPPARGAAWLAWVTGAPLVPIAIVGTQHSLALGEEGFRRTAVKLWIEEPIWWHAYADEEDPVGAMMNDWYGAVEARVHHWA
ncbi:MAG: lysophospholipid acyltransferase family protein [Actinomycetota bacterium]|nr:lysophospholipid acyltransferase family protein [Actinomycetota bacterium]